MSLHYYNRFFTYEEMIASSTAKRLRINNTPPPEADANLNTLCNEVLLPVRIQMGVPIIITSGYRSPELNAAVGGVPNSYHIQGKACDIRITGEAFRTMLCELLLQQPKTDLVIWEHKGSSQWIHVQWSFRPRHQVMNK